MKKLVTCCYLERTCCSEEYQDFRHKEAVLEGDQKSELKWKLYLG